MPTITLTISDEMLARLKAGETTFTLTATLKEKKPRKSEPLPDHLRDAHQVVIDLWARYQPDVSPALAWKTVKPLVESRGMEALDAMALALDWNEGRKYQPVWFAKEEAEWDARTTLDMFACEEQRHAYRKRLGLA